MYLFVHNLLTRQLLGVGQSKPICPWVSVLITINTQISTFIILEPIIHLFTSLSHFFENTSKEEEDFWLRGLDYVSTNYKIQNGTRRYPARSCRELHLDYPDYPSGKLAL